MEVRSRSRSRSREREGEKGWVRVAEVGSGGVDGLFFGGVRGLGDEEGRCGFCLEGEAEWEVNAMAGLMSLWRITARAFSAIMGSTWRVSGMTML